MTPTRDGDRYAHPPPIPVVFEPILKAKPWGGGRLAALLGKSAPPGAVIGESWEIASLPGDESHVRGGSAAGASLKQLVGAWGAALLGRARLVDGRFPLLLKFLDARENLSVQVHPLPGGAAPAATVKHEAWYVIDAAPGATMYVGFRDGVTAADAARAAGRPAFADLLRRWEPRPGDCFYLPSGTPHALGAGLLVAEVQTPSDVTYRLYDWERVQPDGRPRPLHIAAALQNLRFDVAAAEIAPQPVAIADVGVERIRRAACESFILDALRMPGSASIAWPHKDLRIWMVLGGRGEFRSEHGVQPFTCGDTVLVPAQTAGLSVSVDAGCSALEVHMPQNAEGED